MSTKASVLAALALVCIAGVLAAHDFWIIPDAFQLETGGVLEVRGQTSSRFPTSQSAVATERVAEARLVSATSDERLTDLSTSGKSLLIRHRPTTPGQRIVAVARAVVGAHGLWNVRTLHAAPGDSGTWQVYFATPVFAVVAKGGH